MGNFNDNTAELLPKNAEGRELDASFAASMFSSLDDVGMMAVLETMSAMLRGASNDEALAAGNKILAASGRKPIPLI